jgi:hypothetical protein
MLVAEDGIHRNIEVPSTAVHVLADGHETDSREKPGSMLSGNDHELLS